MAGRDHNHFGALAPERERLNRLHESNRERVRELDRERVRTAQPLDLAAPKPRLRWVAGERRPEGAGRDMATLRGVLKGDLEVM